MGTVAFQLGLCLWDIGLNLAELGTRHCSLEGHLFLLLWALSLVVSQVGTIPIGS